MTKKHDLVQLAEEVQRAHALALEANGITEEMVAWGGRESPYLPVTRNAGTRICNTRPEDTGSMETRQQNGSENGITSEQASALKTLQEKFSLTREDAIFLAQMNDKYAMLSAGGDGGKILALEDFSVLRDAALKSLYNNTTVQGMNGATFWLKHPARRETKGLIFHPDLPPGNQQGGAWKGYYNTWSGWAIQPCAEGSCAKYLTHIHENICQGDEQLYACVMAWMAHAIQRPADRTLGIMLNLEGAPGVGKSKFVHWFGKLLGIHYLPQGDVSDIIGKFNWQLHAKLLVFLDEASWRESRKAVNKLCTLITEEKVTLEDKFRPRVTMENFTRWISATNEHWAAPWQLGDRRYVAIEVGANHKEDRAYFKAIDAEMGAGGLERLLWELQHWQIPEDFAFESFPKGEAYAKQTMYNAPPEMAFWRELLTEKRLDLGPEYDSMGHLTSAGEVNTIFRTWDVGEIVVPMGVLFKVFLAWCKERGIRGHASAVEVFSRTLRDYLPEVFYVKNVRMEMDVQKCGHFPGIRECQEQFTKLTGQMFEVEA